jgi:predicted metal-dependent peptidase
VPESTPTTDPLRSWLNTFTSDPTFLAHYPYYAAILARIAPVADPSVDSMAVSFQTPRFYLHVNVDYFLRAPQFVRGILLHEVHHVVLGHLTHPKFFAIDHPPLMELAAEVSANEYIEQPLPNPITWRTFEAAGLRSGQSTMERYEKLVAARETGKNLGKGDAQFVDAHPWRPGGGAAKVPPGGLEWTRQLVEAATREGGESPQSDPKSALLAGRDPGRLLQDLVGVRGPPEVFVDWRAALQAFVARARAPVHTWSRPSRRFPELIGRVPGRIWAPRPVLRPSLLVAIDTSMSMSERELAEISKQLQRVSEHARITIAECDVEVTRVYPFEGALAAVKGRGGTDFRPVFEPALLAHHDGVVFFTDGQGPFPEQPPRVPVLWVLTKPLDFECPWGDRARMDRRR